MIMEVRVVMKKAMMVLEIREEVTKQSYAVAWVLATGICREQVHNDRNGILGNEIYTILL
jgi:hypothetical protein